MTLPLTPLVPGSLSLTVNPLTDTFIFNVKNYGALGNGVADDAPEIQAALDAVPSTGGVVFFPPGTFLINTELSVKSNTTLAGVGHASIIKQGFAHSGTGGKALLRNASASVGNSNIKVYDLKLECSVPTGGPPITAYSTALYFQGVDNVEIVGVRCQYGDLKFLPTSTAVNTATVHTAGNNKNVRIERCFSDQGPEAVYFQQGTNLVCVNNVFLRAYDSTISINSSGERILIANNICDKQGETNNALAHIELTKDGNGDTNGIRDVVIADNQCLNAGYADCKGIQLQSVVGATVTGNVIRNCKHAGIFVSVASSEIAIVGNRVNVSADGGNGIQISNDGAGADIVIADNVVVSVATGSNGITAGGGVVTLTNILIAGNRVKQTVNSGIRVDANVTNGHIDGNLLTGSVAYVTVVGTGWVVRDNPPYNPQGTAAITVTASPFTYTAGATPEAVYIRGGTVSDVSKNSRTIFTASPSTVFLEPGEAVVVTYSVAPTMEKDRK